jgi:hypothetical protein
VKLLRCATREPNFNRTVMDVSPTRKSHYLLPRLPPDSEAPNQAYGAADVTANIVALLHLRHLRTLITPQTSLSVNKLNGTSYDQTESGLKPGSEQAFRIYSGSSSVLSSAHSRSALISSHISRSSSES